ncbi:hypothetical protein BBO99_00008259 [Phytophthora kernoviae]|uniref:Uncharacterized protein n=2 Tax=Phytophthora kernoviae TaxID=325452 RepID=A0A3R7J3L0_9STRA|nr:hypothetical protein G195_009624 [Phytophthora kernoviae 00238/432]KAG2511667.1 hypothetical protein JM16_008175 [Phytophthora kernoviae]KAG2515382.1 hypothetical protein JM18_008045 [Phytophthora kernoviae]RLN37127.1 hypothetical protein BBI17_008244 [Phytophthora kernoviae]RLN75536.1 hypothetical protein BBO99_00008259 [Phytophthora kernoviae]
MPRSSSGIFPRVPSMDKMPHVPSIDKIPRVASLDKLPRIPSMDKLHTVGGGSSEQRIPRVPSIDKMARVPSSDMLSRFGSSDHLSSFPSFSNLSALSSSASYDKLSSLGGGAGFKSGFPRNSSIEDILSLVASSESTVNTVFITGSNRGIGLTFARHYVANGWKVIAAARDVGSASDLAVAKHGTATVCQISSIMGSITENGSGGRYSYRASKAALNMLNMSLSIDLKDDKIVALALHPGYVATRMTANKGEVTKEESVAGLTKIIAEVKPEDSGKYFDFRGTNLPW